MNTKGKGKETVVTFSSSGFLSFCIK